MENLIIAKAGVLAQKKKAKKALLLSALIGFSFIVFGCASSNVSRDAASNFDLGVRNAESVSGDAGEYSIADAYQNSSQMTKGAILGGTAGAVTGALASGVGIIPGTATGLILGASYGSYIDSQTSLKDQLENRGVTMVVLGDQILIVIPSWRIFNDSTATIRSQAVSTLLLVTRFINQYTKMLVKVTAYTNRSGSKQTDYAISQQQADSVARFFAAAGLDARVLYAIGCGGSHLIEKNSQNDEGSQNYRIEITLEKLYV